jgi:hypothetical protein
MPNLKTLGYAVPKSRIYSSNISKYIYAFDSDPDSNTIPLDVLSSSRNFPQDVEISFKDWMRVSVTDLIKTLENIKRPLWINGFSVPNILAQISYIHNPALANHIPGEDVEMQPVEAIEERRKKKVLRDYIEAGAQDSTFFTHIRDDIY